jgi:hypothetical protein
MKIRVEDERYFPTLGILAKPGDEVEIPDVDFNLQPPVVAPVIDVKSIAVKTAKNEMVVNDGSTPQ